LAAAVKELESAPQGNHTPRRKLSFEIANAAVERGEKDPEVVAFAIDEQAGHGIGSTIGQAISKQADVYAFCCGSSGWRSCADSRGSPAPGAHTARCFPALR
jgi:hypothetical protein